VSGRLIRLHEPRKVQVHTAHNSGSLVYPGSHLSLWRSLGVPVGNLALESSRKLSCGEVSGFPGGNFELWRALEISRRITCVHKALEAKLDRACNFDSSGLHESHGIAKGS